MVENKKCEGKDNERFTDMTVKAQMCPWQSLVRDWCTFSQIAAERTESCNNVLIRVNWCFPDETSGTFKRVENYLLDAANMYQYWW